MKDCVGVTGDRMSGEGDGLNMVMPSLGSAHSGAKRERGTLRTEGGGDASSVNGPRYMLTANGEDCRDAGSDEPL